MKYIALKNAAVKVEMEIYQYRTKVGKYSFRKPPAPTKDKKKGMKGKSVMVVVPVLPRVAFSKEMERILDELMASDIQNGSLLELTIDNDPLADVNKRITSNRVIQDGYARPMESKEKKDTKFSLLFIDKNDKEVQPCEDIESQMPPVRLVRSDSISGRYNHKGEYAQFYGKTGIDKKKDSDEHSDGDSGDVEVDDGLKLMTADDYLSLRMLPMVAELSKKTPRLSSWSSTFTICVLVLSVSAAALSTFDRSDFVPAALALSGGITAWASYQQTDLRLVLTNNSLSQLNQLLVWWDGLTMIEKRIPINKETLVKSSELAIISQATVVGGSSSSPNLETKDDGEDNGKK
jgi:hypothetical protein